MKSETGIKPAVRRQHDRAFKQELVGQSLQPGASVSAIALREGINANLLFKWRREHLRAQVAPLLAEPATLVPVQVIAEDMVPMPIATTTASPRAARTGGVIEVQFAGAQLRLKGSVDEQMLASVLRALRQTA